MRETEFKVRGALQRTLSLGTRGVINARQLHEKAMTLHALDHGLVHAHAVHAAADHLDDAGVRALQRLLDLPLDGARLVRDGRIIRDDRLAQLVRVHAESEGRAALQVKPETQLLLYGEGDVDREYGDDQKRKPLPDVVAHR